MDRFLLDRVFQPVADRTRGPELSIAIFGVSCLVGIFALALRWHDPAPWDLMDFIASAGQPTSGAFVAVLVQGILRRLKEGQANPIRTVLAVPRVALGITALVSLAAIVVTGFAVSPLRVANFAWIVLYVSGFYLASCRINPPRQREPRSHLAQQAA
ncbi:hypothetical protein [Sabulicella glaciei]|uniref:Uncharacterized protein n=1 Tax=Sabulicella glaciei TaxID=2984948 RepID=A0ABT3P0B4_9PROT|nr:hypothetical protein [Roseococcus sp. MDT2-1-1]MCW8087826.1 hypothetical protein [Roseococcus sp. MDT2-1-1]